MKQVLNLVIALYCCIQPAVAQQLKLKPRQENALGGTDFALRLVDSTLTLRQREKLILREVKKGNIPDFLRTFSIIDDSLETEGKRSVITYRVLPDYFAIGSDNDFFYTPMTPMLAQRIAGFLKCSLPTKKMVDLIYKNAAIRLIPKPIPPSKAMTTVPVFLAHNDTLKNQLQPYINAHQHSALTAGNKKDIIISNKIYSENSAKVVIYGWHQPDGKPIQPVYNKHTHLWTDYSHGTRLVQQEVWLNGKRTTIKAILKNPVLNKLLSDEGVIRKPWYPGRY